jgi:hypothetical protein
MVAPTGAAVNAGTSGTLSIRLHNVPNAIFSMKEPLVFPGLAVAGPMNHISTGTKIWAISFRKN